MSEINKIICENNQKFRICDCDIKKMENNVPLNNPDYDKAKSVFEFQARSIKGEIIRFEHYSGYVCIIVNIATKSHLSDVNINSFNMLYEIYYPYGELICKTKR